MEIQFADPDLRRRAAVATVAAGAAGAALLWWMVPAGHPPRLEDVVFALRALALLLVVPVLGFTAWAWRLGAAIRRSDRFPPPGVGVVRDTAVLHGAAAGRRAIAIQVLAVGLFAASVGVAVLCERLARSLEG